MKILFAIQGTGNGHLSRAQEIYPELLKYAEIDVLISGIQSDIDLPFPVKYKFYGLSFIFGKNGGVDILRTIRKFHPFEFLKNVWLLPVTEYDLVVTDFEPIAAWASKIRKIRSIGLSHQYACMNASDETVRLGWFRRMILKWYAPTTEGYGFDFIARAENIFTPIIRRQIRAMPSMDTGHYTVYLPAYGDKKLLEFLSRFPETKWEVFSKHSQKDFSENNILIRPIQNAQFIKSLASSSGVVCGGGFQTLSESLFLGKKIFVIPMTSQYEQQYNARILSMLGAATAWDLSTKNHAVFQEWIANGKSVQINFPDVTADNIKLAVENSRA